MRSTTASQQLTQVNDRVCFGCLLRNWLWIAHLQAHLPQDSGQMQQKSHAVRQAHVSQERCGPLGSDDCSCSVLADQSRDPDALGEQTGGDMAADQASGACRQSVSVHGTLHPRSAPCVALRPPVTITVRSAMVNEVLACERTV